MSPHTRRACEARALHARKTLTPRFTDFTEFEKKNDCFAVYEILEICMVGWGAQTCKAISFTLFGHITFELGKLPYFKVLFVAVSMDIRLLLFTKS